MSHFLKRNLTWGGGETTAGRCQGGAGTEADSQGTEFTIGWLTQEGRSQGPVCGGRIRTSGTVWW